MDSSRNPECPAAVQGEGLLHDARNLMGALGLYCDLLSMPGVLKPEHSHYPEELRLLGTRTHTLIEHLMESLLTRRLVDGICTTAADRTAEAETLVQEGAAALSLRSMVEGCLGLLRRAAEGRPLEVGYGIAANVPVRVPQEAVERILVNLVHNASAALGMRAETADPATGCDASERRREDIPLRQGEIGDGTDGETPRAIRIGVGVLVNRAGDPRPWPFRRVRLTVEDEGCGMTAEEVDRLMRGGRAPGRGSHGIGFRVVRELVAATNGDLRIMSQPGVGTRVQIEWAMAPACSTESVAGGEESEDVPYSDSAEFGSASVSATAGQGGPWSPFSPSACHCADRADCRGDFDCNTTRRGSC